MYTLIVFFHNGTCTEIDFLEKSDAIEYARSRKMGKNRQIKKHIIKTKKFAEWLQDRGLWHGKTGDQLC